MEHLTASIVEWVRLNQGWAWLPVFLLAFGESLAFVSLILPSTVILVAISGLLGASGIGFGTIMWIWLWAGIGGGLGYWVSYDVGRYFKDDIDKIWPFKGRPEMLKQGRDFFEKWGAAGVFLGHFFGPVRAVIPVVAGTLAMQRFTFQIANFASSFIWALGVLVLPMYGVKFLAGH